MIRENLDLGRPKPMQLIFDRGVTQATPGPFRTRVITAGVIPSLHINYKGTRIKQYHNAWARVFRTGLGMILPTASPVPTSLPTSFDRVRKEIDAWVDRVAA